MSSSNAINKYSGGVAKYRSSEGKAVKIECRGPVEQKNIKHSRRHSFLYDVFRSKKIKDIPKYATFVRVNRQLNQIYIGKEI